MSHSGLRNVIKLIQSNHLHVAVKIKATRASQLHVHLATVFSGRQLQGVYKCQLENEHYNNI